MLFCPGKVVKMDPLPLWFLELLQKAVTPANLW